MAYSRPTQPAENTNEYEICVTFAFIAGGTFHGTIFTEKNSIKLKFSLEQATKTQREGRGIALLIL